jgi:hypothetical protein
MRAGALTAAVLMAFVIAGCRERAGDMPLGREIRRAIDTAPPGPPTAPTRPRVEALDRVAARWFPVGLPVAEVRRRIEGQHMEFVMQDEGWVRGDGSRCGFLSCSGPYVDIEIANGRVVSAQANESASNIFSF